MLRLEAHRHAELALPAGLAGLVGHGGKTIQRLAVEDVQILVGGGIIRRAGDRATVGERHFLDATPFVVEQVGEVDDLEVNFGVKFLAPERDALADGEVNGLIPRGPLAIAGEYLAAYWFRPLA